MNIKLTKTTRMVLSEVLKAKNPVKAEDIVSSLHIRERTLRYAVKTLCDSELIERIPDFKDLRSFYYIASESAAQALI